MDMPGHKRRLPFAGHRPWCLVNASPDLRTQILSDPKFQPNERHVIPRSLLLS